jgi:DNA segregation ATPase FtsK/SpoIIIE, S-DNA-T family
MREQGMNINDLESGASVIRWEKGHFIYFDDDFATCSLDLDEFPPIDVVEKYLGNIGLRVTKAIQIKTPYTRIMPKGEWWQKTSEKVLQIPIGLTGDRKEQCLELGKDTLQHVLIVGKTGSGKSNLIHIIITSMCMNYSPQEVEVYLVDFKQGVEFKNYADNHLPHARVIAIQSEREYGLSVLQGLVAEKNRRGEIFRNKGVEKLDDYRNVSGERLPRILLVIDEFQEFFSEDDTLAGQATQLLDNIIRQGRSFGIHVILGSQTLAGGRTLPRSTLDQMGVRIALQCSDTDSRLVLSDNNPAAYSLTHTGDAIYNSANGRIEGNSRFQVAYFEDKEREGYLQDIKKHADTKDYTPPHTYVFEGNSLSNISENEDLTRSVNAASWPANIKKPVLYLGEPVAINPCTTINIVNQSGSNLLIIGREEEAAAGIVMSALISLAAQYKPDNTRFYILNFSRSEEPYLEKLMGLSAHLPHTIKTGVSRNLDEAIAEITAEVKARSLKPETGGTQAPVFLIIFGLQYAKGLHQEEDLSYSSRKSEVKIPLSPEQFRMILKDGPDLNVHTFIWCDAFNNFTRILDRRAIREFENRIVFQVSNEDSNNLIDSPSASKLGTHRAILYRETEGKQEKFKPYGIPVDEWLGWAGARLKQRQII